MLSPNPGVLIHNWRSSYDEKVNFREGMREIASSPRQGKGDSSRYPEGMKLPRDISGSKLAKLLDRHYGYRQVRSKGSHMTLKKLDSHEKVTVPSHKIIRVGTLDSIIGDVAASQGASKDEVIEKLFG